MPRANDEVPMTTPNSSTIGETRTSTSTSDPSALWRVPSTTLFVSPRRTDAKMAAISSISLSG